MSFLMTRCKGEIILFWRICQFDRYRNISLSLKNVMFVKNVCNCPTGTRWSFCGNQSNCRICRICILIGECWNGVDSLEILEHCRIAWKGWKVMNDWNVWKDWKDWNVWNPVEHGWISRRTPCLLCVEFLFWNEGPLPSV